MEVPHLDIVRRLVSEVPEDACWAVTGSLCHVLQAVPVQTVGDVDIITDVAGASKIESTFAKDLTARALRRPSDRVSSRFTVLEIAGVAVEVMADMVLRLDDGSWSAVVDVETHRTWVDVDELRVPVMDLSWECHFYARLGRSRRERILRRHLAGGQRV